MIREEAKAIEVKGGNLHLHHHQVSIIRLEVIANLSQDKNQKEDIGIK
jgi:hypothetical protein